MHNSGGSGVPPIGPCRPSIVSEERPVHLFRRLGAICYDALLLMAVLFVAGLPLPLIPQSMRAEPWVRYGTFLYMLLVSFLFFGWFWTHGGQTLGMRAWRIRVMDDQQRALTWKLAWRRFAWSMVSWAVLCIGFLWSLFDAKRRTLHDRFSGTHLVHVRRESLSAQENQAQGHEHQGG